MHPSLENFSLQVEASYQDRFTSFLSAPSRTAQHPTANDPGMEKPTLASELNQLCRFTPELLVGSGRS